jgi:L-threonylcarbamoyladenylate synthase
MKNKTEIIEILKKGGVGVMPSDTIYGLMGTIFSKETVKRIYQLKKRNQNKPLIILIGSFSDLGKMGIDFNKKTQMILEKIWPGAISVVLPFSNRKIKYLNKTGEALAVRFPDDKTLINTLKKTGPLVATSANLEGAVPAESITEARKYFGERVDFYLDGGELKASHSTLIEIKNGKIKILRKGGVDISSINDKMGI